MHAPCIFYGVGVARISSLSDQKESWLLAGCLCLLHACSNSTQHNTSPTKDIYYSTTSKLVLGIQCSYTSAVVHAIKLALTQTKKHACMLGLVQFQNFWQNGHCSIFVVIWQIVSNHSLIRLKRFVSWISSKLCNQFYFYLYLMLHACVKDSM